MVDGESRFSMRTVLITNRYKLKVSEAGACLYRVFDQHVKLRTVFLFRAIDDSEAVEKFNVWHIAKHKALPEVVCVQAMPINDKKSRHITGG